jgi:hypothetical protein
MNGCGCAPSARPEGKGVAQCAFHGITLTANQVRTRGCLLKVDRQRDRRYCKHLRFNYDHPWVQEYLGETWREFIYAGEVA